MALDPGETISPPVALNADADAWDRRIEADILAGRLEEAGQKVDADFDGGRVKPLRYRDCRSRGVGNNPKGVRPDPTPTHHLPGSEGKIRVLEERARLGQPLWHPADARGLLRDDEDTDNHTEGNDDEQAE